MSSFEVGHPAHAAPEHDGHSITVHLHSDMDRSQQLENADSLSPSRAQAHPSLRSPPTSPTSTPPVLLDTLRLKDTKMKTRLREAAKKITSIDIPPSSPSNNADRTASQFVRSRDNNPQSPSSPLSEESRVKDSAMMRGQMLPLIEPMVPRPETHFGPSFTKKYLSVTQSFGGIYIYTGHRVHSMFAFINISPKPDC